MDSSSSDRNPVELLAAEFAERYRRGERPSLSEYTERYPHLAAEICKLFPALVMMEQLKPAGGDLTGDYSGEKPEEAAPPERLGDYRILREVGRGGMGVVYEAEQVSLGRRVALKTLPAALLDAQRLQRFRREAKAAARLHHTNIVPVYGVGEDAGLHYYVMQFIPGLGLDEVLAELRRLRRATRSPGTGDAEAIPGSRSQQVSAVAVAQGLLTRYFEAGPPDSGPAAAPAPTSPHSPAGEEAEPSAALPRAGSGVQGDSAVRLPGQSGGSALSETGRPYWHSVAGIGIQVAEALAYAQGQGVLHRDIKPSNLLLDTQGNVWVTDFGLAKAAGGEDLTHTGDIVGTLRYLAPERFQGQADAGSDQYALGLTLYELLTLRPAFDESDKNMLVAQVMHAEPPRPQQLEPEVPRDLETIVLKALERDPGRRYPTVTELADDLRRFVAGEPIQARRVSVWQRLVLWAKRRPTAAALVMVSGLAALALVAVVIVGLYHWQLREANERTEKVLEDRERILYYNRILLAEREWSAHNIRRAEQLLGECPKDRCGWEWHYLKRVCHGELQTLRGHTGVVWSVAYSPDGERIASAAASMADQTVRIWNAHTGQHLLTFSRHTQPVFSVAFSPDSKLIASGSGHFSDPSQPGELKLWDAATGQEIRPFQAKVGMIHSVAFSPDGRYLAAGGFIGSAEIWDTTTGQRQIQLTGHKPGVIGVAFSPDGKQLATASGTFDTTEVEVRPGIITLWDATTGQKLFTLEGHDASLRGVAFSQDGQYLASASNDETVKIWDLRGRRELRTLRGHHHQVCGVEFSPDGQRLASSSDDGSVKVWDPRTGRELLTLRGHTNPVVGITFSPDGQRLVSASADATVKIWDPKASRAPLSWQAGSGWCYSVAISPDGRRLAGGNVDKTVMIWDGLTNPKARILRGHSESVWGVAFSPDSKYLVSGSGDLEYVKKPGEIKLWDVESGRVVADFAGQTAGVGAVAFHPDGQLVAFAGIDKMVNVWEIATGKLAFSFSGHTERVLSLAFSPDGRLLASSSSDHTVKLWDMTTGTENLTFTEHKDEVMGLAFTPDGKWLASGGWDNSVKVWEVATGKVAHTLEGHSHFVVSVAFSPEGKRLATGSFDKTIKLWDVATGQEIITLSGHANMVWSVTFSPDGKRLISTGRDGTVKIWDGTPLDEMPEGAAPVPAN
jgi:WD40 repeat protein